MTEVTKYIGLDIHKETVAVAIAEGERGSEVRYLGPIPNEGGSIRKLVKRLADRGATLSFCYGAGPCDYGVQRLLSKLDQRCIVIAPSMMPRRPGSAPPQVVGVDDRPLQRPARSLGLDAADAEPRPQGHGARPSPWPEG